MNFEISDDYLKDKLRYYEQISNFYFLGEALIGWKYEDFKYIDWSDSEKWKTIKEGRS